MPEGVATAIDKAKAAAGDKTVALAGPAIIAQALDLDLVHEIAVDLAPVLLGKGIRFFGELSDCDLFSPWCHCSLESLRAALFWLRSV